VNERKRVLIITDEGKTVMAAALSMTNELTGYKTVICSGESFAGTDILPTDVFILGCEKPHPASFAYLAEMLAHVNLAGRKCGIFSTNEKAQKYLCNLVKDCDAAVGEPMLIPESAIIKPDVKEWLQKLLN
jgi:hypothetical protein